MNILYLILIIIIISGINNPLELKGTDRYLLEGNGHRLATTLQGAVYSAIDLKTGQRVIVKRSKKCLVEKQCTRDGYFIAEDVRQESKLLKSISNDDSDAGLLLI